MKHLFQFSLLLLTLLLPATALAYSFEVDGICYDSNGNEAIVTYKDHNRYTSDVTIPATVTYGGTTYSVTSIGYEAFYGCTGLTSIAIPNSVTSIGDGAFGGCNGLTSVTIGSSVTSIGDGAFSGCSSLTSIDIPNSVITIGDEAFYDCCGLTNVTIGDSVSLIGQFAFCGCSGLTNITIPNSVTEISFGTFGFCTSLASITIPNSVTYIGPGAFSYCTGLTSITIPNSVTEIDNGAFEDCSGLSEIFCLDLIPPAIDSNTFNGCYGATLYVPKEAVNAYKSADYWGRFTSIVGIVLPGSTFEVDGIYYQIINENEVYVIANNGIESYYTAEVFIPDSVTYEEQTFVVTGIENNAFDGCFELTSITIPNSVETIGEQAFQGCTGLTNLTIGSGVTAIGTKAFNYCNALETVKCLGAVPPVMASAACFSAAAYNRAQLLVPRQFVETYQAADYWYKFAHIDGWGSAGQGDVNGDGVMSITDVTALIDVLLGNELDSFYYESADLNSNGRIDIGDVTTLIDNLLNGDY